MKNLSEMTPKEIEINMRITELRGWKHGVKKFEAANCSPFEMEGWYLPDGRFFRQILRYTEDLNVMHELEKETFGEYGSDKWADYECYLYKSVVNKSGEICNASSKRRAIAYLAVVAGEYYELQ